MSSDFDFRFEELSQQKDNIQEKDEYNKNRQKRLDKIHKNIIDYQDLYDSYNLEKQALDEIDSEVICDTNDLIKSAQNELDVIIEQNNIIKKCEVQVLSEDVRTSLKNVSLQLDTRQKKLQELINDLDTNVILEDFNSSLNDIDIIENDIMQQEIFDDNIGLNKMSNRFTQAYVISNLREIYNPLNKIISKYQSIIKQMYTDSNITLEKLKNANKTLDRYKGIIQEYAIKEFLYPYFTRVNNKQKKIKLNNSEYTKPDIELEQAKKDIALGKLQVRKNENLAIESKCGQAKYIYSEIKSGHIEKQIKGLCCVAENRLLVLTKDYYQLNENAKADLESILKKYDTHLYILNYFSEDFNGVAIDS